LGHTLIEIDAEDYVSWRWDSISARILRRLFNNIFVDDYNNAVIKQAQLSVIDFILVFKGMHLKASTVNFLCSLGKPVYNFYPDVSFTDHGSYIPDALRYYDAVFTTKYFHGKKEIDAFQIKEIVYVRHGFDPEVHRPLKLTPAQMEVYGCDVSFIGCWSPEKERVLSHIITHRSNLKVVVYGIGWKYAHTNFKKALGENLKPGAFGDELAIIHNASKINLGLLSRAAGNKNVSDQTTVRTFQIPACGSVMLHEDTEEVRYYFKIDKEIMLFNNEYDLLQKIDKLLNDDILRESLKLQGYERCLKEPYDYSYAANIIIKKFETDKCLYLDEK